MSRALALAFLLVASTARGETPGDVGPVTAARAAQRPDGVSTRAHIRRSRGRVLEGPSRRQREPRRQHDDIGVLLPDVEDDGADLQLLVTLLGAEDGMLPVGVRDSGSVGSPHVGSLRAAVQLPAHGGYVVRDPSRAWGTADTVERLTSAFDDVVRADPFAPRVRVHDLSLENGGPMLGHKSHQSGRDVDITYYRRTCERECTGQPVSATELDANRQWRLLRHWLERRQAEFIFIDYALQRPLYEQARSAGATPRQLDQWFQYPRGLAFPAGVIRHVPNHANHVHVRFRCAPRDRGCKDTATRRFLARSEIAMQLLLELVDDESEGQALFVEQLEDLR